LARPVIIFGAGALARQACHYLLHDLGRTVTAMVVDEEFLETAAVSEAPVVGWEHAKKAFPARDHEAFVAIGYRRMRAREEVWQRVRAAEYDCVNIICSGSVVARSASLGTNNFIHPGVVIEPNVSLRDNNVLWSNATACHDTVIGSHNFIAAGAVLGGGVRVGCRSFIGFGSVVLQGCIVGDDVLVGAQALARGTADQYGKYVGVPAVRVGEFDSSKGVEVV